MRRLSFEQALKVRELRSQGKSLATIARLMKAHESLVRRIVSGRYYKVA